MGAKDKGERAKPAESLRELMAPVFRVQLVRARGSSKMTISDEQGAAEILRRYLQHEDREHFVTLMLDAKNRVIGLHTASIGTLSSALISPREVFKAAILANAASIILAHNHPSGDTTPSPEDIQVTETLKRAGQILGIDVLDHLIVGENGAFRSLRRELLF